MLTVEEKQELNRTIATIPEFMDGEARGRRVMIKSAGLQRFQLMELGGPPLRVAGDLVGRLEDFGNLPERPSHHALGAWIQYLLTLEDLPPDNASFLASLIVRHSLVLDPTYIDDLCTQYSISFPMPSPDEQGLQRVINSEENLLDFHLLTEAMYSGQAVCQIENRLGANVKKKAIGTAFLIGPDLLLTAQHVVKSQKHLPEIVARFGYRTHSNGVSWGHTVDFQPDFYFSSDYSLLDYALLRLKDQPLKHIAAGSSAARLSHQDLLMEGKHRGYLVLAEHFIKDQDRLPIIQHPDGEPMKVVLAQNHAVTDMVATRVRYTTDTLGGSSGSPVFNENWEVVALHHSDRPKSPDSANDMLKRALKGHTRVNEGIPIQAILRDFRDKGLDCHLPQS